MPWVNRLANGSLNFTNRPFLEEPRPESRVQQVQDRVLDAADVLIDRQPILDPRIQHGLVVVAQAKRRKYQDESTKVSMVSVSRRAAAPHFGHFTARKRSSLSSGLPLPSGTRSTGSTTGSCSSGTGTVPQPRSGSSGWGNPNSAAARCPNRAAPGRLLLAQPKRSRSAATASTAA
jgi:hypothetical protein